MKSWTISKTIIANVAMAVLVIVQLALDQAWISGEYQAVIVVVVNMILRAFTDTGITVPFLRKPGAGS